MPGIINVAEAPFSTFDAEADATDVYAFTPPVTKDVAETPLLILFDDGLSANGFGPSAAAPAVAPAGVPDLGLYLLNDTVW